MTVRYTAIEGMEQPALRDVDHNAERWRDKIELRLDNRQVFFLFFGSAVVACMLFVLGVMVGKRIESRGQAASPDLQDPLAALDRAAKPAAGVVAPAPQLTFPNTLIAPAAKGGAGTHVAKEKIAMKPAAAPVAAKPALAPAPPKPIMPAVAPAPPKPIAPAAAPRPIAPAVAPKPDAMAPAADPAAPKATAGKGKFTLQLSTFATADEANAFARRYPGAFVISGDVPGRGIAHRVRYGNFASFKDATSAKETFEKQHGMIALVAAR
jgi:cell division septation protein DedD